MTIKIHEDKTKFNRLKREINELYEIINYEMTYDSKDEELLDNFDETMMCSYKLWCQLIKE